VLYPDSAGGLVSLPAGEIKDYNSDEDQHEERQLQKDKPMVLKKPPLSKKSSVAMDLLVKNLVRIPPPPYS
jgi:hypothetical protein